MSFIFILCYIFEFLFFAFIFSFHGYLKYLQISTFISDNDKDFICLRSIILHILILFFEELQVVSCVFLLVL